jgi:hypothetical protein
VVGHEPARNIAGHSEQTYDGKQIHELVHGTLLASLLQARQSFSSRSSQAVTAVTKRLFY